VELSEPIELDLDNKKDSGDDEYAAFEDIKDIETIEVKDKGDSVLGLAIWALHPPVAKTYYL